MALHSSTVRSHSARVTTRMNSTAVSDTGRQGDEWPSAILGAAPGRAGGGGCCGRSWGTGFKLGAFACRMAQRPKPADGPSVEFGAWI